MLGRGGLMLGGGVFLNGISIQKQLCSVEIPKIVTFLLSSTLLRICRLFLPLDFAV